MGVRGLTAYINDQPEKYFEKHWLHDCFVVVDGNCLAAILWSEECGRTAVFGGDYDRLGQAVELWVTELAKANVRPIIIFDGGYEQRKVRTVLRRMRAKVGSIASACPLGDGSHAFPLLLRQVVRDSAAGAGAIIGQADLEADAELAALARHLNCPVLSADSDFFLFGTQFAPLAWLSSVAECSPDNHIAIHCRLFQGGPLPSPLLPLLAAVLGNDFVASAALASFRTRIVSQRKRTVTRVKAVVDWLRDETFDSALSKILESLKKEKKKEMIQVLSSVVDNYTKINTPLDKLILKKELDFPFTGENTMNTLMKKLAAEGCKVDKYEGEIELTDEVNKTEDEPADDDDISGNEEVDGGSTDQEGENEDSMGLADVNECPDWYLERSRCGLLPPCLNTLLSLRSFFSTPQVEDYSKPHAGTVALPLLAVTAGIMQGSGNFRYFCRHGSGFSATIVPTEPSKISLKDIPNLSCNERQQFIDEIMDIPPEVHNLPEEWQLFTAAVIYWARKMSDPPVLAYHIHSLALMLIAVHVFDLKIGYFRNKRPFMARYGRTIKRLSKEQDPEITRAGAKSVNNIDEDKEKNVKGISVPNKQPFEKDNIETINSSKRKSKYASIQEVPVEEVISLWPKVCNLYHTNPELRTNLRSFRRSDVHALAGFQYVVEQAIILNALLLFPYLSTKMSKLYNGTFVYNVSARLSRSRDPCAAVTVLLNSNPYLLRLHKAFVEVVLQHVRLDIIPHGVRMRPRKKKRKKGTNSQYSESVIHSEPEDNDFSDVENKFSVLLKVQG